MLTGLPRDLTRRAAVLGLGMAGLSLSRLQCARGQPVRQRSASTLRLGINVGTPQWYNPNDAFLDFMKGSAESIQAASHDVNGMPLKVGPAGHVEYLVPLEDGRKNPIKYRLITDGDLDASVHAYATKGGTNFPLTSLKKEGGDLVFTYRGSPTQPNYGDGETYCRLRITRIGSAKPTRLALVRDDEAGLFRSGEIFRPGFLADIAGMAHVRMLNWSMANGLNASLPKDTSGKVIGKNYLTYAWPYVPLEVRAALALKTRIPIWDTLLVDDTDAQIAAKGAILDPLAAQGLVIMEYGNEVANSANPSKYAYAVQGIANAFNGQAYHGNDAVTAWTVYRSLHCMKILTRAKGYRWVAGGFPSADLSTQNGAVIGARQGGGSLSDFAAWTCSDYVNFNATQQQMDQWAASSDFGSAGGNITHSRNGTTLGSIADNTDPATGYVAKNKAFARAHGLPLWIYEGGFDLSTVRLTGGSAATHAFVDGFLNSPQAAAGMAALLAQAAAARADVLTLFDYDSTGVYALRQRASWPVIRRYLDHVSA